MEKILNMTRNGDWEEKKTIYFSAASRPTGHWSAPVLIVNVT